MIYFAFVFAIVAISFVYRYCFEILTNDSAGEGYEYR